MLKYDTKFNVQLTIHGVFRIDSRCDVDLWSALSPIPRPMFSASQLLPSPLLRNQQYTDAHS